MYSPLLRPLPIVYQTHYTSRNPRFALARTGENHITNRIPLRVPCNRHKSANLTIIGLQRQNKRTGWMQNPQTADSALIRANNRAQQIAMRD